MTENTLERGDIAEILNLLPHRYPFLLVDRILDYVPDESVRAVKNLTYNESFFQGHFPSKPVMPGVLIIEALAQAAGLLTFKSLGITVEDNVLFYLANVDKAKFKRPVVPGDQLVLEARVLKKRSSMWRYACQALVDSEVVASAEMLCVEKKD